NLSKNIVWSNHTSSLGVDYRPLGVSRIIKPDQREPISELFKTCAQLERELIFMVFKPGFGSI
ncbi:hypothetical protein, partial [Pseudomonas helmanticensis]|uniref:hypothetical protein n=1 Tax=Pseudomonas helmanticensis TaxID=1471381 RepID=UPI001AD7F7DC